MILDKTSKNLIDVIYLPNDLSRLARDVKEFKRLQKLFTEANCYFCYNSIAIFVVRLEKRQVVLPRSLKRLRDPRPVASPLG